MRMSMSAAIAGFAAFACAEVLVRLAIDGTGEGVLFSAALAGLAASLCVLLALAVAAVGARRAAEARLRSRSRER